MKPVDLFHLGPQKSGTTWVHSCLGEHPEIATSQKDSIHYFDMFFTRGRDFYAGHFAGAKPDQVLFDPTPSYLRSTLAPARIAAENPKARLIVCLREPIHRAFSHYWHEKKKGRFNFAFAEMLENYDLYCNWLEPGFYAHHIERYLKHFPRAQLLCINFEEMKTAPLELLKRICNFAGISDDFHPQALEKKINAAGPARGVLNLAFHKTGRLLQKIGLQNEEKPLLSGKGEYTQGVDPELRARLLELIEPETARLEKLLDIELPTWRKEG